MKPTSKKPRAAKAPVNQFVCTDATDYDQKERIAAQLTGMMRGLVRVQYQGNMYSTYPGTDVRIEGSDGHLWSVNIHPQNDDHDGWPDETTIDDRGGDMRRVLATNLREVAARLLGFSRDMEAAACGEDPRKLGYTVAAVDLDDIEIVQRGHGREEADGFAFGFNAEAQRTKKQVRAVVALDMDVPTPARSKRGAK
jgi:hypothetical protein